MTDGLLTDGRVEPPEPMEATEHAVLCDRVG